LWKNNLPLPLKFPCQNLRAKGFGKGNFSKATINPIQLREKMCSFKVGTNLFPAIRKRFNGNLPWETFQGVSKGNV